MKSIDLSIGRRIDTGIFEKLYEVSYYDLDRFVRRHLLNNKLAIRFNAPIRLRGSWYI